MQNKKLLAVAALTGMTLGGLGLTSVASAESDRAEASESVEETNNTAVTDDGDIVQIQSDDPDADTEGETDGDAEADSDADGNRRGHGGCNLEAAAEAIGIDEADLREARENGATIAEIAEENGVDVDDVIAAMVEAKTERIEAKVADGSITQERADEKLAEVEAKITDRVNGVSDRADDDNNSDDSDDEV